MNYFVNEFGLFGDVRGKEFRVYAFEKSTKYLFSYNYIPTNFDSILIGTSASSLNFDSRSIKNTKTYNLSMNGTNISELDKPIDNILKLGNIKTLFVCLIPSLTATHGMQSSQINSKDYLGSISSDFIIRYYYYKYKAIVKPQEDIFKNSYWGYTENSTIMNMLEPTSEINREHNLILAKGEEYFVVDSIALNELKDMLAKVRKSKIKIFAFYYPYPKRLFETEDFKNGYNIYKNKIDTALDYEKDIVVNFNDDTFNYIRENDLNYFNSHHVSKKGAEKMIKEINSRLIIGSNLVEK